MIYFTDGREQDRLDSAGLRDMASLMGRAFMEHDNWKRVIPDPARRRRALTALFRFMGAVVNRHGHIVVAADGGERRGYVTYMENADREQVSFRRVLLCGALPSALAFIAALRPSELASMRAFTSSIEAYSAEGSRDPRGLHLYTTAVDPAYKGKGLMKAAFSYAEARLKAAGFSSYSLETTDPSNLPVYERFGLTLEFSATMPGVGRSVWFFRKDLS